MTSVAAESKEWTLGHNPPKLQGDG
eukprot:IDg3102t1